MSTDLKITELQEVLQNDISENDVLAIVDLSASQTSKVKVKSLAQAGFALADAGSIPASLLAGIPSSSVTAASIDGKAITRNQIADGTIQGGTGGQIDANTITSNEIVSNSLTGVLAPGSVSSTELDALSVGTTELQLLAVGNDQVANTSLTYAKLNLADGDIPGSKINTLDGSKIVSASIGDAKISDVDGSKIVDGSISYAKLDSNDIARGLSIDSTAGTLGIDNDLTTSGSGNGFQWNRYGLITGTQSIASTELPVADASNLGAIKIGTGLAIASGVVSIDSGGIAAANLGVDSVTTTAIDDLAVTDAKINDVSGSKISVGSITIDKLDSSDVARGLSVDATAGTIGINNSPVGGASQMAGLTYDSQGLITGKLNLIPSADLPTADANNLGAVKIGTGIAIANGVISIDSSTIQAGNLAPNAVETLNITDLNVTDAKIAGVSGSKITAGTITYDKLDSADVGRGLSIDNTAGNIGLSNSITAGFAGAVSFNEFGLITGTRTIPGSDIEPATTSALGAVKIGSGLSVDSSGEASVSGVTAAMIDSNAVGRGLNISGGTIGIASSLSGSGSFAGINFNSSGIITSVDSVIPNSDLPKAGTSSTAVGGVYVPSGSGLALDTFTGELSVDASGLPEASIGDLAVSTGKLADGAVTNLKITDVSGSKLTAGSVTYDKLDANDIARGLSIDSTAGTLGIANSIVSGQKAGISFDQFGSITSVAALIPSTDLPAATTTTLGAISVSDGLAVTTAGALSVSGITNTMLGTDSVRTLQVEDLAITDAKIAAVSGAKITAGTLSPNALSSANVTGGLTVQNNDLKISNAIIAGSFAGISFNTQGLITNVSALIPSTDLPISSSTALGAIKVGPDFSVDSSTGVLSVAVDGIENVNLSDDCVTSAELAPGAVDDTALGSGLSGAKISTNSLPADAIVATDLDRSINLSNGRLGINNVQTPATVSGLQFNSEGLIVGTSSILASELPISTASNVGAVSIGSNSGLSVSNAGALTLSNSYTGTSSINGLVINSFGQITSTSQITGSDINVASTSNLGVIKVASGGPFSIDVAGELSLANSGVSIGTYTSVTVDNLGRVTAGSQMTEAQLPDHSAAKITSGTLSVDRIQNSSIAGEKLSDASVTLFGGASTTSNVVTFPATGNFKGQYFWDELNSDLYIYTGASWVPVTISSGEIIFYGLIDANLSVVTSVSSAGAAAGLTVGSNLPNASQANERGYVVVDTVGTSPAPPLPATTLNPPDYVISDGTNWEHLDVSGAIAATTASNVGVSVVAPDITGSVQTTLENLQNNKLSKSGGDISGTVRFDSTAVLQFEGSSEDAFETTLGVVNPTVSDKTILLPDESGTLITTASTSVVTSSMLSNDIVNSNIASNAALSFTKLEALNSGNILVGNSSNEAASVAMTGDVGINNAGLTTIQAGSIVDSMIDSSAAISGSKIQGGSTSNAGVLQLVDSTSSTSTSLAATANSVKSAFDLATQADNLASAAAAKSGDTFSGNVIIDNAKEIRFTELSPGSNYISFKAPDAINSDISLVWPNTSPQPGEILKANASNANQLEWSSDSSTDNTKLPLTGGQLTGNLSLQGQSDLRFADSDSSHYVGLQAPGTVGTSYTLTLPSADASVSGWVLASDGSGTLSWVDPGSTSSPTFTGDISLTNDGALVGHSNLNALYTGNIKNLIVTVATKTSAHRYYSLGSNSGFLIDSKESPFITLTPGRTYRFDQSDSSNSGHPLRFYLEANKTNSYSANVLTSGTPGSTGAYTQIEITDSTPQILFYQCSAHSLMGNSVQTNTNQSDLSTLNASKLSSGLIPDARFPSTLPTVSGVNLTNLNADNISSGTIDAARVPTLNQDTTGSAGSFTAGSASNLDSGTVPIARLGSSGSPSGSTFLAGDNSWQTITGTTINNNADNRLITGSSTQDTLEAEANLTFDGLTLATPRITLSDSLKTSARVKIHTGATAQYETIDFDTTGETSFKYQSATRLQLISSGVRFYGTTFDINGAVDISGQCVAGTFSGNGASITHLDLADATNTGQIPVARLGTSGSASNSTFLRGDNTWATPSASDSTKMPLTGGTFTGDVIFEGATTGRDITFDRSDDSLLISQQVKIKIGNQDSSSGNRAAIYEDQSNWAVYKNAGNTGIKFNWSNLDLQVGNTDIVSVDSSGAHITGNITATGTVTADSVASSANGMRRITTATTAPSTTTGFADGDLYIQYNP